jgi:heme A synthase
MLLWALALLLSPTPSTTHLVLGLAVVLAALIVAAATGIATSRTEVRSAPGQKAPSRRVRRPRLADPDAAGRPRPRAPSAYPTAA